MPGGQAREAALALMDRMGLDRALARRFPAQLSGGQQQRVGVARALAADPAVMLMDEPFGAVDPIVRVELQRDLLRLQREEPRTILFVTHDMSEAFALGDRIVLLAEEARVVAVSTIALVSVSGVLGINALGMLFVDGFQRGILAEVVAGIVATVVIALAVDALLVLAGRALLPWVKLATRGAR